MLSTSHSRAYQDFLTLLTDFSNLLLDSSDKDPQLYIKQQFQELQIWFEANIVNLDSQELEPEISPRWESIQREIKREFKLLTTDILFLASARQDTTKIKRLKSIRDRLTKLSGYCRGLLEESEE